jgi:hypothetical protein
MLRRTLLLVVVVGFSGCALLQPAARRPAARSAKECAACTRMCEVGGEAEKNANVENCKAKCEADCT